MNRDDGKIRDKRVLRKLIDSRNNLKKLHNVTRLANTYIANLIK